MKTHLSRSLVFVLVLASAGTAFAHDMFIMPDKFRISTGETLRVGFHSADGFPGSTAVPKRLQAPSAYVAGSRFPIPLREDAKRMVGDVSVAAPGHVIVTATNSEATETMKPASFLEYIREEGLSQVIQAREQRGENDKPARERYTMFAKSIVLAGAPNDEYKRVVGLPIEIIPEKDPYSLKSGESLPIRVLYKGAPAAGLQMLSASDAKPKNESIGRTDAEGRILVPVTSGKWRLHTIYMERAADAEADWESFWATLTFEIP